MPSPIIEAGYRNKFEVSIAEQLEAGGVEFTYETLKLPIAFPPRTGRYTPDFICGRIILEGKGYFYNQAADRQKLILAKAQHPDLDFRLVFQSPSTPIYKGSKTTYAKWAEDHGFKWCSKVVPKEWLEEINAQQKRSSGHKSTAATKTRRRVGHG